MDGWGEKNIIYSVIFGRSIQFFISLGNLPSSRFKVFSRQLLGKCGIQQFLVRIQAAGLANGGCVSQRMLEFSPSFSSWSTRALPAFRKEDK
jgi:hypothetical protein